MNVRCIFMNYLNSYLHLNTFDLYILVNVVSNFLQGLCCIQNLFKHHSVLLQVGRCHLNFYLYIKHIIIISIYNIY